MNSSSPTTQTYSGAQRLRALPMYETPAGDLPAMSVVVPGISPEEFKTGRRLQAVFDQQVEIGLQRTLPGSIVRLGGDPPRQKPPQVLPIEDVDPGTVLLNFDIGQDESVSPDTGSKAEHQQQSELEHSLQQFLHVDTTTIPKCVSCEVTSTKGTCLICGKPLCPDCTHICPTSSCAIRSCSHCAREHWPRCAGILDGQNTAITDKDQELDEDEPPAKRLDSSPRALPDIIQDDSSVPPPPPPVTEHAKAKAKAKESPRVKKSNVKQKSPRKSPPSSNRD